jgi:dTDP-4-dehydrorhamnose 3,5-epimerase
VKTGVRPTPLPGVVVVAIQPVEDERGFFLEPWNRRDFEAAGLALDFVQEGHSRSRAGVLRGIHYQDLRAPMGKLVRCTLGAIFDVAVDLRAGAPTFGQWYGLELSAANKLQLYVPVGFGHGFAVLSEVAEVQYKMTGYYTPAAEGAVRWDDPELAIGWPVREPILSPRDRRAPLLAAYRENPAFP